MILQYEEIKLQPQEFEQAVESAWNILAVRSQAIVDERNEAFDKITKGPDPQKSAIASAMLVEMFKPFTPEGVAEIQRQKLLQEQINMQKQLDAQAFKERWERLGRDFDN